MGRYCSYLLPRQDDGTPKTQVNRRFSPRKWVTLYNLASFEHKIWFNCCRDHEEDFFGIERCLRCIDKGMRGQVLSNLRRVRDDGVPAGTWVYQPVYPRVLDKLNELLGHFQNDNIRMIKKRQSSVTSSSSSGGSNK